MCKLDVNIENEEFDTDCGRIKPIDFILESDN